MEEPSSRKRKAQDDGEQMGSDPEERDKKSAFLSRPPLTPHLSVTTTDGRRGYIELEELDVKPPKAPMSSKAGSLLPSFSSTYDDVIRSAVPEPRERKLITESQLWVSKYAPKKFTDLISDEVLEWLKGWDEVVFGSTEFKTRMAAAARAAQERQMSRRGRGGGAAVSADASTSRKAAFAAPGSKSAQIGDKRPEKRVLLLHGPPGAGKTTLAHVIATQAGYRAVEINARSASSMYTRVLPALEMESVNQGKPNCVILDEIDGAVGSEGQSAVDCIIAIANFKAKVKSGGEGDDNGPADNDATDAAAAAATAAGKTKAKRKSKKKAGEGPSRPQSRPIICICNELYTPSLARLREIALVIKVDKPDVQRLVHRLRRICDDEQFTAETKALAALAELTECDIRSSLNALQYLRRKSSHLRVDLLASGTVGEKDQELGIFKVWDELFRTPVKRTDVLSEAYNQRRLEQLHRKEVLGEAVSTEELDDSVAFKRRHYSRLYDVIQYHSDRDRIIAGAWANLFASRMHDPQLSKMSKCIEWFEFVDVLNAHIRSEQSFALSRYLPASMVAMSLLVAADSVPQFAYPREESEVHSRQTRSRAVGAQLKARSGGETDLDLLTPLLSVIQPPIRTNNITVLQPAEKDSLLHAAEVMAHYGLSYTSAGDEGGLRLEPPLDKLTRLAGYHGESSLLTETQKEFVQREIDRIHMLEEAQQLSRAAVPRAEPPPPTAAVAKDQKRAEIRAKAIAASQELATRAVVARDFFGRPIAPKQVLKAKEEPSEATAAHARPPVTYKFKEGYTNAVRRKVYIRDFL